jgi:hypothetical protein
MEPGMITTAQRAQALAESMDCLTEDDLCALYDVEPSTAEAWRKRRKGPPYIRAGNAVLYPRSGVKADLDARVRSQDNLPAKELL